MGRSPPINSDVPSQIFWQVSTEKENLPPKLVKMAAVSADQAGELSVIAEGGHAGIFRKDERAGEAWMEENRKMEFRIPCQIADQREAGESRSEHDAVCSDFLRLVSTVEHLQAVSRAVCDVHALLPVFSFASASAMTHWSTLSSKGA